MGEISSGFMLYGNGGNLDVALKSAIQRTGKFKSMIL
jgi:hypothetical protein